MRVMTEIDALRKPCADGVSMTIGMFDGVHRGHQMLIGRAVEEARRHDLAALVFTFREHPLTVLAPPYAPKALTSPEEKLDLIAAQGVDCCLMLDFTPEFAAIEPGQFLTEIVARLCRARFIVCGPDFRFGKQGRGDVELLKQRGETLGYEVEIAENLIEGGMPVKSTRVRQSLFEGDVEETQRLLGRPYRLSGTVVKGDRRGRTLGFPTANLQLPEWRLVPGDGVYAVRAELVDLTEADDKTDVSGRHRPGMMNIGKRPTFAGLQRTHEVFLFDFEGDLYGQEITVHFIKKIRDERKFESIDDLIEQLESDESTCRRILGL